MTSDGLHTKQRDLITARIEILCSAMGLSTADLARDVQRHLGISVGPKRLEDAKYGSFPNLLVGLSNAQVAEVWQHLERHAKQAKAKGIGRKPGLTAEGLLRGRPVHMVDPGQLAIGELRAMCSAAEKANLTERVDKVTCKSCRRDLQALGYVNEDGSVPAHAQRAWERWTARFSRGG
jgi:hypothetical protein